jgi:hypothetical protein
MMMLDVVYIRIPILFCMAIASPLCICVDARTWYYSFFDVG